MLIIPDSHTENIAIEIYPNPAESQVNIKLSQAITTHTTIELVDISGKAVYAEKIETGEPSLQTINLSALAEGIYLMKISNAEYCITKKLIKTE